ncbi:MAG: adenylate/guanylate cyclase domain-containing protein [Rhizobiaceae bacterium]|nr:adenylate/guanylate cyclase domain-containing protein [Rhizobiaceae bacterium]
MLTRLRLISGIILTAFVVGHFINHALGIISLKAMNDALKYFIQPWREPIGEALIMLALLVHVVLAVQALYQKQTLKMRAHEWVQLVSGFLIPLLLVGHVMGTRGLNEAFGVEEGYQFTLYGMWVPSIYYGVLNLIALPVVWVHTCLGWHYWLRLKPWYAQFKVWFLGFAIVLPTLALAGYASASLRVARLSNSESWVERTFRRTAEQLPEFIAFVNQAELVTFVIVPSIIAAVFCLRWLRSKRGSQRSAFKLNYRDLDFSKKVEIPLFAGVNLLDQLRLAEVPHASVCGGRGRCSTCRVRIDEGLNTLPPASAAERRVLDRINAGPEVRLACQTVPNQSLSVTALLEPQAGLRKVQQVEQPHGGDEQEIAVLFADIRGFTQISEDRLPFDTAFLLNRYFAAMGRAIEESGGHLDKFIGDGVMALFGVNESMEVGCRKAINAAIKMSEQLEELNNSIKTELPQGLRIGIGIHCGAAIVGKMGYKNANSLTAIGDVVNTASRLESLTKEHGVQFIVSEKTINNSGLRFEGFKHELVKIRGREQALSVCMADSATDLLSG